MGTTTIKLKRATYYAYDAANQRSIEPREDVTSLVLHYGEPLYLSDLQFLIIGDGITNATSNTVIGTTVQQFVETHRYFPIANDTELFGDAKFNKDLSLDEDDYTIINVKFLHDYVNNLLSTYESLNISPGQTLTKLDLVDGVLVPTYSNIMIKYGSQIEDDGIKPLPSDAGPLMDNTANPGISTKYAREDHVHPKDTTKADKITTVNEVTYSKSAGFKRNLNGTDKVLVTLEQLKEDLGLNNVDNKSEETILTNTLLRGTPKAPDINNTSVASEVVTKNYFNTTRIPHAEETNKVNVLLGNENQVYYITGCKGTGSGIQEIYKAIPRSDASYNTQGLRFDGQKGVLFGAAWNDFAEYRETNYPYKPGTVVCETGDGTVRMSTKRLQAGSYVVSDTYGMVIGEQNKNSLPLAVAGRVLAYYSGDIENYHPGDAVCAADNGCIARMTRREIRRYPDRILGYVSEIPSYEK